MTSVFLVRHRHHHISCWYLQRSLETLVIDGFHLYFIILTTAISELYLYFLISVSWEPVPSSWKCVIHLYFQWTIWFVTVEMKIVLNYHPACNFPYGEFTLWIWGVLTRSWSADSGLFTYSKQRVLDFIERSHNPIHLSFSIVLRIAISLIMRSHQVNNRTIWVSKSKKKKCIYAEEYHNIQKHSYSLCSQTEKIILSPEWLKKVKQYWEKRN